jgi:hypothetical protein
MENPWCFNLMHNVQWMSTTMQQNQKLKTVMALLLLFVCVIGFWLFIIFQIKNSAATSIGCGGGILFFVLVDAYILRLLFRRRGKHFSWFESVEFSPLLHFIALFITGSIFVVLLLLVKLILSLVSPSTLPL